MNLYEVLLSVTEDGRPQRRRLFFDQGFPKNSGSSLELPNNVWWHSLFSLHLQFRISLLLAIFTFVFFKIELDFSTKCTSRLCVCEGLLLMWLMPDLCCGFLTPQGQSIGPGKGKEKDLTCNC